VSQIATLSEFLDASGCQWQVYDLSRRVQPLAKTLFTAVEQGQQPFPAPRQQQAWLAITFWQSLAQPYIWFIALPLDERGGFQHAAMQHFMSIVVEALGANLTSEPSQEQEKLLEQNPYVFQPDLGKRAAFHAQFTRDFDLPASLHFETAQAFFHQQTEIPWEQLGVQGLHDVMQRLHDSPTLQKCVLQCYNKWPQPLRAQVNEALSHTQISSSFAANWLRLMSEQPLAEQLTMLASVSAVSDSAGVQQYLRKLYNNNELPSEALCILTVARLWSALKDERLFELFIEHLSLLPETTFQTLFKELVVIPELRIRCLQLLHAEQKSNALIAQLRALQNAVAGTRS